MKAMGLVVVLVGCAKGAPCIAADVQRVSDVCRVEVVGAPTYRVCHDAHLVPTPGFSVLPHQVDACTRQGAGTLIACLSARSATCAADGGLEQALAQCSSFSSPTEQNVVCDEACRTKRDTCEHSCPTSDWNSCADCDARCSTQFIDCSERC